MDLNWKVSKDSVFLFLCFCMWVIPTYIYNFPLLITFSNLFWYATIGVIILDYIKYKRKCSVVFWLIFTGIIIQGVATQVYDNEIIIVEGMVTQVSNDEMLSEFIRRYIKEIAFCYIIDQYMSGRKANQFLNVFSTYLGVMIFINLVTIILFPKGIYTAGSYSENYWMGYDNTHIRWQLPAMGMACINSLCLRGKLTKKVLLIYIMVVISNLLVFSGTALVSIAVLSIGMIYILVWEKRVEEQGIRIFSALSALAVAIIGSVIVVGATVNSRSLQIIVSISNILGKDVSSLAGRSYIWINSLAAILRRPVWGYGYEAAETTSKRLVGGVGYGFSPHNICLETLYYGGIMLGIVTCAIYIAIFIRNSRYRAAVEYSVCGLWLITISIMGLVEPQYGTYMRLAWLVCYNMPFLYTKNGIKKMS